MTRTALLCGHFPELRSTPPILTSLADTSSIMSLIFIDLGHYNLEATVCLLGNNPSLLTRKDEPEGIRNYSSRITLSLFKTVLPVFTSAGMTILSVVFAPSTKLCILSGPWLTIV